MSRSHRLEYEFRVARAPDAELGGLIWIRFFSQIEAHLDFALFREIQRVPQRAVDLNSLGQ